MLSVSVIILGEGGSAFSKSGFRLKNSRDSNSSGHQFGKKTLSHLLINSCFFSIIKPSFWLCEVKSINKELLTLLPVLILINLELLNLFQVVKSYDDTFWFERYDI